MGCSATPSIFHSLEQNIFQAIAGIRDDTKVAPFSFYRLQFLQKCTACGKRSFQFLFFVWIILFYCQFFCQVLFFLWKVDRFFLIFNKPFISAFVLSTPQLPFRKFLFQTAYFIKFLKKLLFISSQLFSNRPKLSPRGTFFYSFRFLTPAPAWPGTFSMRSPPILQYRHFTITKQHPDGPGFVCTQHFRSCLLKSHQSLLMGMSVAVH